MNFFNVLEELCNQRGTNITSVLKELGYSTSKGTAWRNGSIPTGDILLKLAKYFNVSVDYLLGYTANSQPNEKSEKLLKLATKLTEDQVDALIEMSSHFLDT